MYTSLFVLHSAWTINWVSIDVSSRKTYANLRGNSRHFNEFEEAGEEQLKIVTSTTHFSLLDASAGCQRNPFRASI